MSEKSSESQHGDSDRKEYWSKQIEGKTVGEIADIISSFEVRATRDKLTGLINRGEFENEFNSLAEDARRRGNSVYVLFLDFDDLKKVNDSEGHAAGDELLKKGSAILRSSLRPLDLLGRIGGDEFAAALEIQNDDEDIHEKIMQRIVTNSTMGGTSISVGISKYNSGDNLSDVIKKAEINMKMDKTDRKAGRDFIK
jgi:diguanylate cyclase (GGDEF)-like protein